MKKVLNQFEDNSFEYKGISISNNASTKRYDRFNEMNQGISKTSLNIIINFRLIKYIMNLY